MELMGMGDDDLAAIAKNSFAFSTAPDAIKAAGSAAVDSWLDRA